MHILAKSNPSKSIVTIDGKRFLSRKILPQVNAFDEVNDSLKHYRYDHVFGKMYEVKISFDKPMQVQDETFAASYRNISFHYTLRKSDEKSVAINYELICSNPIFDSKEDIDSLKKIKKEIQTFFNKSIAYE